MVESSRASSFGIKDMVTVFTIGPMVNNMMAIGHKVSTVVKVTIQMQMDKKDLDNGKTESVRLG